MNEHQWQFDDMFMNGWKVPAGISGMLVGWMTLKLCECWKHTGGYFGSILMGWNNKSWFVSFTICDIMHFWNNLCTPNPKQNLNNLIIVLNTKPKSCVYHVYVHHVLHRFPKSCLLEMSAPNPCLYITLCKCVSMWPVALVAGYGQIFYWFS